ncbi:hypothetical protein J7382_18640, partial [Shimia sp. R11_0]|uniref:hypothetical protein n=1 Tax=Shimia sp. R11_0 TaxID=2821096 RepID=UPI001ADC1B37
NVGITAVSRQYHSSRTINPSNHANAQNKFTQQKRGANGQNQKREYSSVPKLVTQTSCHRSSVSPQLPPWNDTQLNLPAPALVRIDHSHETPAQHANGSHEISLNGLHIAQSGDVPADATGRWPARRARKVHRIVEPSVKGFGYKAHDLDPFSQNGQSATLLVTQIYAGFFGRGISDAPQNTLKRPEIQSS